MLTRPRLRRHAGALAALLAVGLAAPLGATQLSNATAAEPAPAATTDEVRTKIFGAGWDDPDAIRTKWISITTWIASFGGTVVLFDSTVMDHLQQGENRTPEITLDEVIAAKPEAILQNHTHLDQMRHASRIAAATGAKLMTTQGGCLFAKRDAAEKGLGADNINCDLILDDAGHPFTGIDTYASPYNGEGVITTPFGTKGKPATAVEGLDISAVIIKHSQLRPYPDDLSGPGMEPKPERLMYDPPTAESLEDFGLTQDIDNGNLAYLVTYKDFSLVHHGSTGSLNTAEPGEAEITSALQKLGADDRVDVEIGGIAELNYFANGFVESRRYSEAIGAKLLFPTHHNNWLPPITSEAAYYYEPWTAEMKTSTSPTFPEMCFVTEENWATVFSYTAGKWGGESKGAEMVTPMNGPGCYTG